ncbi:MAG TPA: bifunctional nuclease family protein [archaeon]
MMGDEVIAVEIKGIYMVSTTTGHAPVVLLTDDGHRFLPIYIGISEAISINAALKGEVPSRPMTHDLIMSILENFEASIVTVVIDDVDEGIYFARLSIKVNGTEKQLDARPSDCIALAIRSDTQVLIRRSILDDGAISKDELDIKEMDLFM